MTTGREAGTSVAGTVRVGVFRAGAVNAVLARERFFYMRKFGRYTITLILLYLPAIL